MGGNLSIRFAQEDCTLGILEWLQSAELRPRPVDPLWENMEFRGLPKWVVVRSVSLQSHKQRGNKKTPAYSRELYCNGWNFGCRG